MPYSDEDQLRVIEVKRSGRNQNKECDEFGEAGIQFPTCWKQ